MFSPWGVGNGRSSCIWHLYPTSPRATLPMLVAILHTARVMKAKQITAVTYFQPPSSSKLSHQKLSMSPVQPQKSKQSRNVRCQIVSRLLWTSASGRQVPEWTGPVKRCRKRDTNFTDCLGKSCKKKLLLLLQADPHGHKECFALQELHAGLRSNATEVAGKQVI